MRSSSGVVCFFVLLSLSFLVISGGRELQEREVKLTDEAHARAWLLQFDKLSEKNNNAVVTAAWNYNVNLTDHNNLIKIEASLRSSHFAKEAYKNTSRFDWKNFKDPDLVRRFSKVTKIGESVLPDEDRKTMETLQNEMILIYSVGEVCDKPPPSITTSAYNSNLTCFPQNPDLLRITAASRNWDEQLWAWKGWRDATGKKIRTAYSQLVQLANKAAVLNGYKDHGDYWRSYYEMQNFTEVCDALWTQVKPLYQQLHAFVRRKLMKNYSKNVEDFPKSGHIPAHLTGNIWAQTWGNILDLVTPYPGSPVLDITNILKDKGFDVLRMVREADNFFISLGLQPMPKEFWERSLLEKPKDGRNVTCHASAWDFFNKTDFRIKQCTDITGEFFFTTHHEMGHVQYYLHYRIQPPAYREGANPGFHEAVGDVISLSVNTPGHMHKIGLLNKTVDNHEADLNFLMKQGLDKIAFLPYAFLLDKWRWEVYQGKTTPANYNRNYWKLRCEMQGISPPIPRSEEDFDPGAKFHIVHDSPYVRYFVSYIIQFQFHKALCETAGHKGPLHKCDIYNSTKAGNKLKKMLEFGSSKPWPEAMEVLTGQPRMDAGPFLDYFQPLYEWLMEENRGKGDVTWDTECPPGTFLSKTATVHRKYSILVLTPIAIIIFLPFPKFSFI